MSRFRSMYSLYNSLHNPEMESEKESAMREKKESNRLRKNFVNSFSNLKETNFRPTKRIRGDSEPSISSQAASHQATSFPSPRSRKVPAIKDHRANKKENESEITNTNDEHFSPDDDGIPDLDDDSDPTTSVPSLIRSHHDSLPKIPTVVRKNSASVADLEKRLDIEKAKNKSLESELAKTKQDISSQDMVIREKMDLIKQLQGKPAKSEIGILRENAELRRKNDEFQKTNKELEPAMKELKKVRKLLMAKIQVCDNESEETDDDNLRTCDTLSLLKKYEEVSFRHDRNSKSSAEQDEIVKKLERKVEKLQTKNEKLKSKVNTSDNGSLTLRKLEELQDALKVNSNQPEKVNEMNESLKECKTKLNLQKQINVTLEKQQQELMDVLKIPLEDRSFAKCLNALKALQEKISNSGIEEHEEVLLYDNAERVLQRFESE